jgi:hypothetical protein
MTEHLYREGAENGRVMCLSLHPHNIGRPNAAKHLDEALNYILGHGGLWATADNITEYYLASYYDQMKSPRCCATASVSSNTLTPTCWFTLCPGLTRPSSPANAATTGSGTASRCRHRSGS